MEQRVFPRSCLSQFCGESTASCLGCPAYSNLQAFKAWVERTAAQPVDRIWAPNVYQSTR